MVYNIFMPGYFYHYYNFGPLYFLAPFVILELVLKGFALWRAAQNKQKYWFIALLLINSIGILPLIYLFISQKKK